MGSATSGPITANPAGGFDWTFEASFPWEALQETPADILARDGIFGFGVAYNDDDDACDVTPSTCGPPPGTTCGTSPKRSRTFSSSTHRRPWPVTTTAMGSRCGRLRGVAQTRVRTVATQPATTPGAELWQHVGAGAGSAEPLLLNRPHSGCCS